jgi:hypothetical protein
VRATFDVLAGGRLARAVAAAATSQPPAIARPGLPTTGAAPSDARGVVFFLESSLAPGMVAVGTAHTLAPDALARAQRVELALPGSLARVAVSERFAVAPGRPFSADDGTMRDDFAVFLLSARPKGVRALSADPRAQLESGARVRVLGPGSGKRNEEAVVGAITSATAERIEIQLDAERSLDGWGGAPVLDAESGRVVGMLEAALPGDGAPRVLAARSAAYSTRCASRSTAARAASLRSSRRPRPRPQRPQRRRRHAAA